MNDYKELIADLTAAANRNSNSLNTRDTCRKAADAIEQLVKERGAAVADMNAMFEAETEEDVCKLCAEYPKHNCFHYSMHKPCNPKWRGVQE